jgi:sugar (pentulose or hexulose) kinase
MAILAVDLGTTNIKVAAYDDRLRQRAIESAGVSYLRDGDLIEFNAEDYFLGVLSAIRRCCEKAYESPSSVKQIVLTGQAESLVVIDSKGAPVRNGISWLDMRSRKECVELREAFKEEVSYPITGQPSIIPTWPITKILWMKKHEKNIYDRVSKFLLLKDYIQYRLTGKITGEYSIYNFTHYFDITKKRYWREILSYCGVQDDQLPPLIEPCTNIGTILPDMAGKMSLDPGTTLNVGTLDHFAGMIGTGNISTGIISESTGTVLSIATMVKGPSCNEFRIPCHYGAFKDTYVLLPVCESGGISLEWYKDAFLPECDYDTLNRKLGERAAPDGLIFLPYLTGVNAPDFNPNASGVFYGLRLNHDKLDLAYAVMEGVAHLLKKNISSMEKMGIAADRILSTGGGARSDLWSQMKADITGYEIAIPQNEEAACLGAAMIGAVTGGLIKTWEEATQECVSMKKVFTPRSGLSHAKKHAMFEMLYQQLLPVYNADLRG